MPALPRTTRRKFLMSWMTPGRDRRDQTLIGMPADWHARCAWFEEHRGATADDYEEAHK